MDGRDRREPTNHDDDSTPSGANNATEPTVADDTSKSAGDDSNASVIDELGDSTAGEPEVFEDPTQLSPERVAPKSQEHQASESVWNRFWRAEDGPIVFVREILISVCIVLVIGLLLFGVSGVWPPMVAVESGSMEPNINQYDLVFVTDPGRFAPGEADDRGIVSAETAETTGYSSFNQAGSVIVFHEPGSRGSPIIHRAHFFVEEGENWHDRANPDYLNADDCAALANCPAPHSGYITKGDNQNSNSRYDQASGIAPVVEPDWVTGVARLRIPYLGWIRLAVTGAASTGPLVPIGLTGVGGAGVLISSSP